MSADSEDKVMANEVRVKCSGATTYSAIAVEISNETDLILDVNILVHIARSRIALQKRLSLGGGKPAIDIKFVCFDSYVHAHLGTVIPQIAPRPTPLLLCLVHRLLL